MIKTCDRTSYVRNICYAHYNQMIKGRPFTELLRYINSQDKKPCKHPNCTRNVHARNLCASHYNIVMAYTKTDKSRTCSLENCNNKHRAKGLCIEHADIKYKNGILFQHQDIVSDINESDE